VFKINHAESLDAGRLAFKGSLLPVYHWRKLTELEKQDVLRLRIQHCRPWHSPPHRECQGGAVFIVSAACYEHKAILGFNDKRMLSCRTMLNNICSLWTDKLYAWCVLPNHYHILVKTKQIGHLRRELGRMHGRTARVWNLEEQCTGRKVWFNCVERKILSKGHFWASVNYIHHNPVKHGYCEKWTQWPFSSAADYLSLFGNEKAFQIWKEYPILGYGDKWDF
jgi:putative transposase